MQIEIKKKPLFFIFKRKRSNIFKIASLHYSTNFAILENVKERRNV